MISGQPSTTTHPWTSISGILLRRTNLGEYQYPVDLEMAITYPRRPPSHHPLRLRRSLRIPGSLRGEHCILAVGCTRHRPRVNCRLSVSGWTRRSTRTRCSTQNWTNYLEFEARRRSPQTGRWWIRHSQNTPKTRISAYG